MSLQSQISLFLPESRQYSTGLAMNVSNFFPSSSSSNPKVIFVVVLLLNICTSDCVFLEKCAFLKLCQMARPHHQDLGNSTYLCSVNFILNKLNPQTGRSPSLTLPPTVICQCYHRNGSGFLPELFTADLWWNSSLRKQNSEVQMQKGVAVFFVWAAIEMILSSAFNQ